MAEDVNFPLDQGRTSSSALQGIREFKEGSGKPRTLEGQEEEANISPAQEQRPANELANLENRSELSSNARAEARAESQNTTEEQEPDIAEAERRELQSNRQEAVSEDARANNQGSGGTNPLTRVSEGAEEDPQERLDEGFRIGNEAANPDRIEDFQAGDQPGSVQEAAQQANENAVSVEQENFSSRQDEPTVRELPGEGAGPQGREALEQIIAPETPRPQDAQQAELQENKVAAGDAKIQEKLNEERAVEAEKVARNTPAIDTPEQRVEQVEPPEEPVEEAQDNNPLRGPRPSELRDESDASAVETERGQNVSNLI